MLDALNERQFDLFSQLAKYHVDGLLFDPISPIPAGVDDYVVYLKADHNMRLRYISDLDALCAVGLLDYRLNRFGDKKTYAVSAEGANYFTSGLSPTFWEAKWPMELREATGELKVALGEVLSAEMLGDALIEISFVRGQLLGQPVRHPEMRLAMQRLTSLVAGTFKTRTAPVGKLGDALRKLGVWCKVVEKLSQERTQPNPQ